MGMPVSPSFPPGTVNAEANMMIELHHFGLLDNGMYKGGKVCYVDNCIHDYLSLLDLKKIGIDLGYKVDITQRVTHLKVYYKGPAKSGQHAVNEVVNDSCIPGLVGSISLDQVLVLYYHDPTHNNELECVDEKQEQHSEIEIGNEKEEEEKEDVIVDSDYEVSEEENGNEEAAYVHDGPPVEEAACFEEMKEMPINEATGQISDDGEDTDRLPSDGDSSGGEEDGRKKTSKRKWKMPAFKQFRKETDLRNPEFRIGMHFGNKEELKEAIREYAIVQGRQVKLVKNDNRRIQAKCVGHTRCPFILFASKIDRDEETFAIKTLSLEHECTRVDKLKYTNSRWLSNRFADKIRKNPEWDVGAFQSKAQPNQPNPTIGRGRGRGRGTTTGKGRGNGRGQMPIGTGNGGGNVGNGATSSQPLPSSQPLSYIGATSSSSQPPNIVEVASQPSKSPAKRFKAPANRVKSPAKRFKSPAKKLRPWMW
ncbi:hypothetical protein ACE6H2_006853 [Prunus campanulata]